MHLGIEAQTGAVFEGRNNPDLHVRPQPPVSQCHLIRSDADWQRIPPGFTADSECWVFREDTYDPVTRIRRGRVYQAYGLGQPQMVVVYRPPQQGLLANPDQRPVPQISMYHYIACTALLAVPNRAYGLTLVVGAGSGISAYTIVQMEQMLTGDVMVTLKERSALGVIPELNEAAVPPSSLKPVRQALERVVNAAFRETAVSVVDQCRNAMATILGHFLATEVPEKADNMIRSELAPLSKLLMDRQKEVCGSAALIVARMHSRGKSNEQYAKGAREPGDDDAQFAVHAVGLVMREIGWAR